MRVFVSSQVIDRWPARDLIAALRVAGAEVEHSPSNPLDREDVRWKDWYRSELGAGVERCDAFVIVVEPGWDSSTWMAVEAEAGVKRGRAFFWNPDGIVVKAAGMMGHLQIELARRLDDAVAQLCDAAV